MDIDLATDRLNNMIISHDVLEELYIVMEAGNVWYFHDCQKHLNASPQTASAGNIFLFAQAVLINSQWKET